MADPHARRGIALGIEVDDQDPVVELGQRRAEVDGGRGLADTALLVGDRDDEREHDLFVGLLTAAGPQRRPALPAAGGAAAVRRRLRLRLGSGPRRSLDDARRVGRRSPIDAPRSPAPSVPFASHAPARGLAGRSPSSEPAPAALTLGERVVRCHSSPPQGSIARLGRIESSVADPVRAASTSAAMPSVRPQHRAKPAHRTTRDRTAKRNRARRRMFHVKHRNRPPERRPTCADRSGSRREPIFGLETSARGRDVSRETSPEGALRGPADRARVPLRCRADLADHDEVRSRPLDAAPRGRIRARPDPRRASGWSSASGGSLTTRIPPTATKPGRDLGGHRRARRSSGP